MKIIGLLIKKGAWMNRTTISRLSTNIYLVGYKVINKYIRLYNIKRLKQEAYNKRLWHENAIKEMESIFPNVYK